MTNHRNYHLLLMRHGKSDWDAGGKQDFDRPLTQRGNADVRKIARWMRLHKLVPDLIVSSPAVRTRDTAKIVVEALKLGPDLLVWEQDIYEASLDKLLVVIGRYSVNCHCLLLIGHNPGLDSLITYLASAGPDRTGSGKLMTTSALAIFDYADSVINTAPHAAQLQQLIRPKEIG